ncbi:hypothetical protein ACGFZB_20390 [Streptomyces cinerochromogenes]|uniref:Uncharacterized protein n=1 Tax=Streptomyces cinerochromogenes TaxID=66422 RepID=A0ABW7B6G9_9ACTN
MSTEARRAPTGDSTGPAWRSGAGNPAAHPPMPSAPPAPADDPDEEPSVFTPRGPRPPAVPPARPHRPGPSAVPEPPAPASPPPPPASARFPDTPPASAEAERRHTTPTGPHGPTAQGPSTRAGSGGAATPVGGAEASGDGVGETTTARLRAGRRSAPAETPSETTARLRPIRSVPPASGAASASARASAPGPRHPAPTHPTSAHPAPTRPAPSAPPRPAPAAGSTRPAGDRGAGWSPMAPAHPVSPGPDPAHSWGAASGGRPVVSFAEPDVFGGRTRPRVGSRTVAAAACLMLGLGLIGGAATGSWLTGDGGADGTANSFGTARTLWHSVPVDELFPPTVQGTGAGPGGADRTWTRIAVAPDSGCAHAFDPLLYKALAPVGCQRLLRATYTDATQSYVTTVGLLFTKADPAAMSALAARFRDEHLDSRADLMPRPYAAAGTVAAAFGDRQRASWTISVLTDAPVVAYAVSGWTDGRTVDAPQPAADAVRSGATTAPAQAGLGQEAQGLADRVQRRLRKTVGTATEKPS